MTRPDKDAGRMAAALEQRVKHLVPDQPLLTQSTGGEVNPVALAHPPGMGHLAVQLDCSARSIHRIEGDVGHLSLFAGAGDRLFPPLLIESQRRNRPGTAQRGQRRTGGPRCRAGAGTHHQKKDSAGPPTHV